MNAILVANAYSFVVVFFFFLSSCNFSCKIEGFECGLFWLL